MLNKTDPFQWLSNQLVCEINKLNEGWAIFDADGELQIQKIDEDKIFESDDSAIRFVLRKAFQNPNGIHSAAIILAMSDNKKEYDLITEIYLEDESK